MHLIFSKYSPFYEYIRKKSISKFNKITEWYAIKEIRKKENILKVVKGAKTNSVRPKDLNMILWCQAGYNSYRSIFWQINVYFFSPPSILDIFIENLKIFYNSEKGRAPFSHGHEKV